MNKDILAIKTLKINGVSAVNKANSGHPGIVLGASTMMHTLFSKHLNFDPKNPKWINRDRFVLSVGHGSALLYSQLRLLGLISTDDLKNFRQYKSVTPGHPEFDLTQGVESTTGPLGQGIGVGVGLAVAEEFLRSKFKEINHYTYVICGDGDLQEGVSYETLAFAGRQNLSKLIVMYDSNDVQLDTLTNLATNENIKLRMEAIGFEYILVKENTVEAIDKALIQAKKSNKPSFLEIKTIIGEGATKQGTSAVHGAPIGDDIKQLRKKLNWTKDGFFIPKEVKTLYQETIIKRSRKAFKKFKLSDKLKKFLENKPIKIEIDIEKNVATRVSSGKVINYLSDNRENWLGGSADLSCSTKASGGDGVFDLNNRSGRNFLFGVREFGMGTIANGLALHSNLKPFVSTFFVFADYIKPSIRLAAIMKIPVTYVFTHDSVFVGEDGPTHEPIEQLAMMRSIPNIKILRPADEKEVIGAYEVAYNSTKGPTAIILTRQNIVSLEETSKEKFKKGSYKIISNNSEWTLIASGSELANATLIGKELKLNVVSISNFDFNKIDWNVEKAISIEAATTFGMRKFAKFNIGIDTFGESAPGDIVYKHFKLDQDSLKARIKKIIK